MKIPKVIVSYIETLPQNYLDKERTHSVIFSIALRLLATREAPRTKIANEYQV